MLKLARGQLRKNIVEDNMAKKEEKTLGAAIDEVISALEGLEPNARATAVTAACEHLKIPMDKAVTQSSVPGSTPTPPPPSPKAIDIKTLKEEKEPRGANEMACVVAHYLQELVPVNERKDTITIADRRKYFKQAQFKLPTAIHQTLVTRCSRGE